MVLFALWCNMQSVSEETGKTGDLQDWENHGMGFGG